MNVHAKSPFGLTVSELARLVQRHPRTVKAWIRHGLGGRTLVTRKVAGSRLVPIAEAERFLGVRFGADTRREVKSARDRHAKARAFGVL